MKVSEAALLKSGFSHADLQKIKNSVDSYDKSLRESIHDLVNRFRIKLWVFFGYRVVIFPYELYFGVKFRRFSAWHSVLFLKAFRFSPPILNTSHLLFV